MAYTPDPTLTSQPTDDVKASTAAAEFRALKAYLQSAILGAAPVFRGYIDGLNQTSPGASPNHTIGAGQATDSLNTTLISFGGLTKTTSNWAVGTAAGGKFRAAAIAAASSYWWYLVRRPDTGVVDVGFSTSATGLVAADFVSGGGNLPNAYTQWRSLHGWKTDGSSQWTAASSIGDDVFLAATVTDYASAAHGTAATLFTTSCPVGRAMRLRIQRAYAVNAGNAQTSWIWNPSVGATNVAGDGIASSTNAGNYGNMQGTVGVNASAQAYVQSEYISTTIAISTGGWIDQRGRGS